MSKYAYLAAGLLVLSLLAASHWKTYVAGGDKVRAEWQAEKLAAEQKAARDALRKQNVIDAEAYRFAEKAQKDRVIVQTKIVEVEKYVPNSLPMLPGDFRLYHDAAAAGQEIDDSRRADAAPVAPKTVAVTVAENYAACLYDQQRLEALQTIVRTLNGE